MEGAAIAHCGHLFSVPVLVIRSLSDVAGIESPVSFDEFLPVASKHSAYIVMRILRKIKSTTPSLMAEYVASNKVFAFEV
jgi:adenosylhomocysteine nucleosidase